MNGRKALIHVRGNETFLGMVDRIKEMGTHEGVQPDELTFGSVTGWMKELKGNEKVKRERIQTNLEKREFRTDFFENERKESRRCYVRGEI